MGSRGEGASGSNLSLILRAVRSRAISLRKATLLAFLTAASAAAARSSSAVRADDGPLSIDDAAGAFAAGRSLCGASLLLDPNIGGNTGLLTTFFLGTRGLTPLGGIGRRGGRA